MPTFLAPDGTALHYDVVGDERPGECPVIVLAGGAARHPRYLGDLAGLAGEHPLVLPHLRGVGESPAPDRAETGSFWRQAEDIEALRVHLGAARVVVVGHSAGTRLALAFAVQFPHRLAGLVLLTPPAGYLVDETPDADVLIARRRGDAAVLARDGDTVTRLQVAQVVEDAGSWCTGVPTGGESVRWNLHRPVGIQPEAHQRGVHPDRRDLQADGLGPSQVGGLDRGRRRDARRGDARGGVLGPTSIAAGPVPDGPAPAGPEQPAIQTVTTAIGTLRATTRAPA